MPYASRADQKRATDDWYANNTEHKKAMSKAWRAANPLATQYHSLRQRAAKAGIPFRIKLEDIDVPTHCPILGVRLRRHKGKPGPNSPSVDRINSRRGYFPDNIRVISYRANMMKRDGTLAEWEAIVRYMRKNG